MINLVEGTSNRWGGRDPLDPGAPWTGADPGVVGNGVGVRQWALGAWYAGNYPACVHFHSDRLCFAGAPQFPQRIDMSNSGAYELFSPSALLDDTVTAANACSFALNSNTINAIGWMHTDQHGLMVGTLGAEWVVDSASTTEPISPTSISAKQASDYGAVNVAPLHVGKSTLFLQAGGRKLRDMKYNFAIDGFEGGDLSVLAEHLTVGGFATLCVQLTPYQILWLVREDGTLVSVSYDAEQNEVAWCAHTIGGYSDAAQTVPAKVLSADVIPSPDGTRDEVWLAVQRHINGADVVYIERMSKVWEVGDADIDTSVTPALPRYVPDLTTFLDSSQRLTVTDPVTEVSGLTWLEGQTVGVLADGAAHPDCVVESGSITLAREAKDVVIGYNCPSIVTTLPIEAGSADGPAQGKVKRIHNVIFQVYETAGFEVVGANGLVTDLPFRATNDYMDEPPPLQTGNVPVRWEGTYDREGQITFRQSRPLPLNVSGLVVQLETQDGG